MCCARTWRSWRSDNRSFPRMIRTLLALLPDRTRSALSKAATAAFYAALGAAAMWVVLELLAHGS